MPKIIITDFETYEVLVGESMWVKELVKIKGFAW